MAILKFNGISCTVDHAVKGEDYVHGYDENGNRIVAITGIKDFSSIEYDSGYLSPLVCKEEECNDVKSVFPDLEDSGLLQVTNIYAGTTELEVGLSKLPAGSVYLVYE